MINELNFCFADASATAMAAQIEHFKDSTVLIRGGNHSTVNKILAKMQFDYEPKTWQKQPAMSLVLEHIYGVQTSDRRHSVMYIHYSMNPEQLKTELAKGNTKPSPETLTSGTAGSEINPHLNMVLPQILGTTSTQQIANELLAK